MPYDSKRDQYASSRGVGNQARNSYHITVSDTEDLPVYAKAVKVNGAGTFWYIPVEAYKNGSTTPVKWVSPGPEVAPVEVARVMATNTTLNSAGDLVALTD